MLDRTNAAAPDGVTILGFLTASIGRAGTADAIYDAALAALEQGLDVRRAAILLFDPDRVMRFKAWRGLSETYRRAVEGHSPWQPDTRDAQVVSVPDVSLDPGLAPFLPTIRAEGIAGMLFVPLTTATGVIGKFMLYFERPRELTDSELTLARVIAAQVAFAVQGRRAEDAVRASEALLRQLTDSLPQIVWMTDADGRLDYYNQRWQEFSGFDRTATGDEYWRSILHPDDLDRSTAAWTVSVASGDPYEVESRFFDRASGTYRWHLARALPVRDGSGRIIRWCGTSTDIDDQKRAEQVSRFLAAAGRTLAALEDYPTALQTVASLAVPDFADWCAVDVVDRSGGLRRVAVASSERSTPDAASDLQRRYPPRPNDPCGPHTVMRTGEPELIQVITDEMLVGCAHDDAHLEALRAANLTSSISVPFKSGGQILGAMTFLTSDSGHRYRRSDLSVAQELAYRVGIAVENAKLYSDLQQADRQKDEFLAVLAHELRNPLAPMRTALQLVRATTDERAQSRAHAVMDRQLQHMVRLVDDLLDVSRITRGKIALQREPRDLAGVLHDAVETSRPAIEAAGHALTVTLPPEPVLVDADATRLAQVFSNLLNNAAKFTPHGGRITIAASREGGQAVVRVRDTGAGIPADMLTGIFDMFTQVDCSLEKTHEGLGIGLTIVKRLVEMHGGTVEARSEGPGAGSEFVVQLPLAAAATTQQLPVRGRPPARTRTTRRVLVVDDNRDAADCLAEMLRLDGHDVRTAHDGLAALDAAEAFGPDAVLLDLGLPRLSGYDAAARLRERLPADVLLIALTGWGQPEHRQRSQEVGFDHHFVKPVDVAALSMLLER